MPDAPTPGRAARRTLLKALAAGWVTPVIHSVVVPLHAQVSPPGIAPESLAGAWSGEWVDEVAGLDGTATMTVTVNPGPRTFTLVLDLNGPVFNAFDPAPQTFNGTYTEAGGTIGFQVIPRFGVPSITISPVGVITGSMAPLPEMGSVQMTGTVTSSTLVLTYTATAGLQSFGGTLSLHK